MRAQDWGLRCNVGRHFVALLKWLFAFSASTLRRARSRFRFSSTNYYSRYSSFPVQTATCPVQFSWVFFRLSAVFWYSRALASNFMRSVPIRAFSSAMSDDCTWRLTESDNCGASYYRYSFFIVSWFQIYFMMVWNGCDNKLRRNPLQYVPDRNFYLEWVYRYAGVVRLSCEWHHCSITCVHSS